MVTSSRVAYTVTAACCRTPCLPLCLVFLTIKTGEESTGVFGGTFQLDQFVGDVCHGLDLKSPPGLTQGCGSGNGKVYRRGDDDKGQPKGECRSTTDMGKAGA